MHKFEFASKKIKLSFPNAEYTVILDSILRSRAVAAAMWMENEAQRRAVQVKTADALQRETIFEEITEKLCGYIDEFLGDGAHEKILGERISCTNECKYLDVCNIMGYILGTIREEWEKMHGIGKTEAEK